MIKINGTKIPNTIFPDGSALIKLDNVKLFSQPVRFTWLYENDAELFTLICLAKHFENYEKCLLMPYCPHARMDRVQNAYDIFTLKYFCEVINSLNFKEVWLVDVHSNVAPALLNRVRVIDNSTFITDYVLSAIDTNNLAIFFPDEGANKRYSSVFNTYPSTFGVKKRDWNTGKIQDLTIIDPEVVKGKDVLIIDDICSYGGTFCAAAAKLKEAGCNKIYLAITHCESNIFKGHVFDVIDEVFTTNSIIKIPEDLDESIKNRIHVDDIF